MMHLKSSTKGATLVSVVPRWSCGIRKQWSSSMTNRELNPQPATVGCTDCRHFRGGLRCDAYPEGIPWPIIAGEIDHVRPLPGDDGIQFEPMRRSDWEVRFSAFGYTIQPEVEPDTLQLEIAWLRLSPGQ